MIGWVVILGASLAPLGAPPPPKPPVTTSSANETRSKKESKTAARGAKGNAAPKTKSKTKLDAEEKAMLQNAEFLAMLELLLDLPILADDEELEAENKEAAP
ncbi:MAG: hypothetical protein AAF658_22330 [Myxococcota bacterium]